MHQNMQLIGGRYQPDHCITALITRSRRAHSRVNTQVKKKRKYNMSKHKRGVLNGCDNPHRAEVAQVLLKTALIEHIQVHSICQEFSLLFHQDRMADRY